LDELDKTAPIETPAAAPPADSVPSPAVDQPELREADAPPTQVTTVEPAPPFIARPAAAAQQEVMFVPLAVSIGDGFKFGCGFFLAMVIAGLVGLILVGLLLVLSNLFGLNAPFSR
jgi:hypothetical protein